MFVVCLCFSASVDGIDEYLATGDCTILVKVLERDSSLLSIPVMVVLVKSDSFDNVHFEESVVTNSIRLLSTHTIFDAFSDDSKK